MVVNENGAASVSERPLSLDTTKDKYYNRGAVGGECPRSGSMLLESMDQRRMLVNTDCNAWRCVSCRSKNVARFKAIVEHGVSALGQCMFITITYKQGCERLRSVGCVARDWQAFWRSLKSSYPETKEWGILRVMEVTKKRTPHYHLIVGALLDSDQTRCYGTRLGGKEWFGERFESCECWSHRMSRVWRRVQRGESYIVHTMPVIGSRGAASYMAKYLAKTFGEDRLEALGMSRRYSVNRLWPRERRRRVIAPGTDGWKRSVFAPGKVDSTDWKGVTEFGRTGSKKQVRESESRGARRLLKRFGKGL